MNRTFIIQITKNNIHYSNDSSYATAGTTKFGITAGSMSLEQTLCDGDFTLGEINSAKFEVQLFNLFTDVTDAAIIVYCVENNVTSTLFSGTIDSSKTDKTNEYRDIVAYDAFAYVRDKEIIDIWNTSVWQGEEELSLGTIRTRLLTALGLIEFASPTVNNNLMIQANSFSFTSAKFSQIYKMICELQAVIPFIHNGLIRYTSLDGISTDISSLYDTGKTNFEDYVITAITHINVYGTSNELSQTVGTPGANPYNIVGNVFLLGMAAEDITTALTPVLNVIKLITYNPAHIEYIISDLSYMLGKKLSTVRNSTTYYHYILGQTFSDSSLVIQTIDCKASGETRSVQTSTKNDVLVEGQKYSKLEQTIDGIIIEVGAKNKVWKQNAVPSGDTLAVGDLWYVTGSTAPTGYDLGKWYYYKGNGVWEETTDATIIQHTSQIQQNATDIQARVTKTGGDTQTFAWILNENGFELVSNNDVVFQVTSAGIAISGSAEVGSSTLTSILNTANDAAADATQALSDAADALQLADNVTLTSEQTVYYEKSTDDPPTKPSSWVTSTSTATGGWRKVIPVPVANYYYFTCTQTKLKDGTTITSDVKQVQASNVILQWCADTDTTKIDGGNIYANSVTASQIDVDNLWAAIVQAETITADAIRVISGSKVYLDVDASTSTVQIAGFNANDKALYNNASDVFSSDVFLSTGVGGTDRSIEVGGHYNTVTEYWGLKVGPYFGVLTNGYMYCTGGQIGGFKITDEELSHGTMGAGASMFLIPAGRSGISIAGSPTTYLFGLTLGPKFGVTIGGYMYAEDVHVEGNVTMTTGTIGEGVTVGTNCTISSWNGTHGNNGFEIKYDSNNIIGINATSGGNTVQLKSGRYIQLDSPDSTTSGTYIRTRYISIGDVNYSSTYPPEIKCYGDVYLGYNGSASTTHTSLWAYKSTTTADGGGHLYGTWYTSSGSVVTSDRDKKNTINDMADAYEKFFDGLKPKTFKYNDGTSGRLHTGFIAQEVKDAILNAGLTTQDTGIYVEHTYTEPVLEGEDEKEPVTECCLRYDEIISLNTWQIQKLKQKIKELEERLNNG